MVSKFEKVEAKTRGFPKVRSHDEMYNFSVKNIIDSLVLETKISPETSLEIAEEVINDIGRSGMRFLTGGLIREMAGVALGRRGMERERIAYTRIGIPLYDITEIIQDPSTKRSNANLLRNPETIAKLIHDEVMENYTLYRMPKRLGDAHLRGDIYIKDRDYFYTRDYCASWDIRQFLILGLAPDGMGGRHSSYASPAKHAEVAVNHAAIWLAAAQSSFSGGQGYFYFNTLLAPYMRGLSKKRIRQCAQQFVFVMTQQYVSRGGQVVFSSIDLTPGIPDILRDVPAVKPGAIIGPETYGEYEQEAQDLFDAFIDVFLHGDGKGKLLNYPKPNLILKEEFMGEKFKSSWLKAAELTIKFGTPYFENYLNWRSEIAAGCSSCCSHLWVAEGPEEIEKFKTGNMVFGATQMVTPNFGRAAWIAHQFGGGTEEFFFKKLEEYLELVRDVFFEKKMAMDTIQLNGNAPFYNQPKPDGSPLLEDNNRMYLIGTIGFNEMCEIMTGEPIHESKGKRFGLKVIKWLTKQAEKMAKETGLDITVTRTPAESAAGRLAMKDYKAFPGIRRFLRGTPEDPYYTNGTSVDFAAQIGLSDRIKTEAMFHPFLSGGALTHIYLGDIGKIEPEAVWKLIQHIAKDTLISYFCFTRDLSFCSDCGQTHPVSNVDIVGGQIIAFCSNCGSDAVEIYSRITGYTQSLASWNSAKKQEFLDRHRYSLGGE